MVIPNTSRRPSRRPSGRPTRRPPSPPTRRPPSLLRRRPSSRPTRRTSSSRSTRRPSSHPTHPPTSRPRRPPFSHSSGPVVQHFVRTATVWKTIDHRSLSLRLHPSDNALMKGIYCIHTFTYIQQELILVQVYIQSVSSAFLGHQNGTSGIVNLNAWLLNFRYN